MAAAGLAGMGAAGLAVEPFRALLCLACIILAASGSAMANSAVERDTDAMMPRLHRRTAALVLVGHENALYAALWLVCLSCGLAYAYIGETTALLIMAAVFCYVPLYTLLLKKRSPYAMLAGGVAGALPVPIGCSVSGTMTPDAGILFMLMMLWQPPHFIALALRHEPEYRGAGLPVLPVARGAAYAKRFALIFAAALPPITLLLTAIGSASMGFALFALATGCLFFAAYYLFVFRRNEYSRAFGLSLVYLFAVLAAFVVDKI